MENKNSLGKIILLNGTPRSGKSSIVKEIQKTFDGIWMNLGVDVLMAATPEKYLPGIGLRPGGERPDLEPILRKMYLGLYASIAAHSRLGLNVVADLDHHNDYAAPLEIFQECGRLIKGCPVMIVGIHCPIEEIMERRIETWHKGYEKDGSVPLPVQRWQQAVHQNMSYDLELDTSLLSPIECARLIAQRINAKEPCQALDKMLNHKT